MATPPSTETMLILEMRMNTKMLFTLRLDIQKASLKSHAWLLMGDGVGGKATGGKRKKTVPSERNGGLKHTESCL